jgi:hypothetical protein
MKQLTPASSSALSRWYASHSSVRRLWVIEDSEEFRVVVALEPSLDGDDTWPVWLANCDVWVVELRMHLQRPISLAHLNESLLMETEACGDGVVVADLCWRDPCANTGDPGQGVLSARRNEDDGCQIVEAAVMRRALSTRSGAGPTHVGAASPRKTGQQHGDAAGGEALE